MQTINIITEVAPKDTSKAKAAGTVKKQRSDFDSALKDFENNPKAEKKSDTTTDVEEKDSKDTDGENNTVLSLLGVLAAQVPTKQVSLKTVSLNTENADVGAVTGVESATDKQDFSGDSDTLDLRPIDPGYSKLVISNPTLKSEETAAEDSALTELASAGIEDTELPNKEPKATDVKVNDFGKVLNNVKVSDNNNRPNVVEPKIQNVQAKNLDETFSDMSDVNIISKSTSTVNPVQNNISELSDVKAETTSSKTVNHLVSVDVDSVETEIPLAAQKNTIPQQTDVVKVNTTMNTEVSKFGTTVIPAKSQSIDQTGVQNDIHVQNTETSSIGEPIKSDSLKNVYVTNLQNDGKIASNTKIAYNNASDNIAINNTNNVNVTDDNIAAIVMKKNISLDKQTNTHNTDDKTSETNAFDDKITAQTLNGVAGTRKTETFTEPQKVNVAEQVSEAVSKAVDNSRTEVKIHLNPEDLGGISIRIISQNGNLSVKISADNRETSQLIASSMGELTASMQDKGLTMEKAEVSYAGNNQLDSSTSQQSNQFSQSFSNNQNNQNGQQQDYNLPKWTVAMDTHGSKSFDTVEETAAKKVEPIKNDDSNMSILA